MRLDGVNQWSALRRGEQGPRQEMVYNLKLEPMSGAVRQGRFKLIFGRKFAKQGWYDTDHTALVCSRDGRNGVVVSSEGEVNTCPSSDKRNGKVISKDTRTRKYIKIIKQQEGKESKKHTKTNNIDCNWEDFLNSGHSNMTNLLPRTYLMHSDIVELQGPIFNPFNISALDEAMEFEEEPQVRSTQSLESQFDHLDSALYDLEADPEERTDLKLILPEVASELRERSIQHLRRVVEADFPPQDPAGKAANFGGVFSSGWCKSAKGRKNGRNKEKEEERRRGRKKERKRTRQKNRSSPWH